jgi:hypothetical protein
MNLPQPAHQLDLSACERCTPSYSCYKRELCFCQKFMALWDTSLLFAEDLGWSACFEAFSGGSGNTYCGFASCRLGV